MKNIKEVTVYTKGDSRQVSTWSNFPYFFTTTLEQKKIKVNRVNIASNPLLEKLFDRTITRILRKFYNGNNTYDYSRSIINYFDVKRKIFFSKRKYTTTDLNLFLTFSFSTKSTSDTKTALFCDWTYDYFFQQFQERKPNFFERQSIRRENAEIKKADKIFLLFSTIQDHFRQKYNINAIYLDGYVINALKEPDEDRVIKKKSKSNKILFVGTPKYLEGARALLDAFKIVKEQQPEATLHFIGISPEHLPEARDEVFFYGYLNKNNPSHSKLYYDLLEEVKVFVNTTPKWSAYSASVEAMYFYTPVIVPPYDEFQATFGADAFSAGYYCLENQELAGFILEVFRSKSYEKMCLEAHNLVKEFSWSNYIDKFLKEL